MNNYVQSGLACARGELSSSIFSLSEPSRTSSPLLSESSSISISKTFSPKPYYLSIIIKLFLTAWAIGILGASISSYEYPSFWLAYLTDWGWVFASAYFLFSLVTAVYLANRGDNDALSTLLFKTTWSLFAVAFPAEIMVSLLYWILLDGGNDYLNVMMHGIGAILIFIDGILWNRIPLRMKQFILYESFSFAYLIWSLIFSYSDLTNPWQRAGYKDDDAIYPPLRWKTETTQAAILCVIIMLVSNPIVFVFCRWLSRILPLRLIDEEEKGGEVEIGDTLAVSEV